MRVSATIDRNVVSAHFLLDDFSPVEYVLKHRYEDQGITRDLQIHSAIINPTTLDTNVKIINPHYNYNLYLQIGGNEYRVMDGTTGDIELTENPINDKIYTQNQVVLPEVFEVVVSEPVMKVESQTAEGFSHGVVDNLLDMADLAADKPFVYSRGNFTFDVTDSDVTVKTDVIDWNHAPEITVSLKTGQKPDIVRLVLINSRGTERTKVMTSSYELFGRLNYSELIVSSPGAIRLEFVYKKDASGYKAIRIEDMFVGKINQYVETTSDERYVHKQEITFTGLDTLTFNSDYWCPFGLRVLISDVDTNGTGIKVFISNRKVLVRKMENGTAISNSYSPALSQDTFGIVCSPQYLKIYDGNTMIKSFVGAYSFVPGTRMVEVGACESDPDHDLNANLRVAVFSGNRYPP